MPLSDIYSVIETELGKDSRNLFETFDEEPLGSASLAQVRFVNQIIVLIVH